MKTIISLSRLPGENPNKDFMSKLADRFKKRDALNKKAEEKREEQRSWFDELSDEAQEKYLEEHPGSQLKSRKSKKLDSLASNAAVRRHPKSLTERRNPQGDKSPVKANKMKLIISMSAAGDSLDSQLADLFSQYKQAYEDSDTDKVRTIMRQVQAFGKKLVPYLEKAAKHPCAVSPNSELINGYTVKSLDRAFEYCVTDKSTQFRLYVYVPSNSEGASSLRCLKAAVIGLEFAERTKDPRFPAVTQEVTTH